VWGSSELTAVAAARFAAQLELNARHPAVHGALTDVAHDQVAVVAGRLGASAGADDDIFRDRVDDDGGAALRMRVLILRDTDEISEVAALREAIMRVAERFDVPAEEVTAVGEHPVSRLASLVAPLDFASVYLGLLQGFDPTSVEPVVALEALRAGEQR
jgi:glucose/mannose-6-phosphate isomerase